MNIVNGKGALYADTLNGKKVVYLDQSRDVLRLASNHNHASAVKWKMDGVLSRTTQLFVTMIDIAGYSLERSQSNEAMMINNDWYTSGQVKSYTWTPCPEEVCTTGKGSSLCPQGGLQPVQSVQPVQPVQTDCAKDYSCFDQRYTCDPCCTNGVLPDGTLCWDATYTHERCCNSAPPLQVIHSSTTTTTQTGLPSAGTCAKDPTCFDAIYNCSECCNTGKNANGVSCWNTVFTRARCCADATMSSSTGTGSNQQVLDDGDYYIVHKDMRDLEDSAGTDCQTHILYQHKDREVAKFSQSPTVVDDKYLFEIKYHPSVNKWTIQNKVTKDYLCRHYTHPDNDNRALFYSSELSYDGADAVNKFTITRGTNGFKLHNYKALTVNTWGCNPIPLFRHTEYSDIGGSYWEFMQPLTFPEATASQSLTGNKKYYIVPRSTECGHKVMSASGSTGAVSASGSTGAVSVRAIMMPAPPPWESNRHTYTLQQQGQNEYLVLSQDRKNTLERYLSTGGLTSLESLQDTSAYFDQCDQSGKCKMIITKAPKGGFIIRSSQERYYLYLDCKNNSIYFSPSSQTIWDFIEA